MDNKPFNECKDTPKRASNGIVYPEFVPYFSSSENFDEAPVHHGLFDKTPEQVTNGKAPWDEFGWSRDNWVL